ncbi:NAD-dependent epimerase/dehydratase family protein [Pseudalkalibacillus sp. R45]|uniref:NAD-dependent epimerase/dehydratase family protein n=1 Tax=Pseudalkalibacillus sp. R45 TaxID=3457433 RepID=UPI003FCCA03E
MSKIMVTGGSGFIGSHIVEELLDEGHEVIVVDNFSTGKKENLNKKDVSVFDCDIRSQKLEEIIRENSPEYIIHQAAQSSVPISINDFLYDHDVNIKGSLNIIDLARKNGVKKIVFASSAAIYGNPVSLPVNEKHPVNPLSPYGVSKLTIENYLKISKELYGLDYTVLRYGNVYGPRQDAQGEGGVVAIFADRIMKGEVPYIHGDGNQTRDFIFVKDIARANVSALKNGNGAHLNLSSNTEITINKLFGTMSKLSGKEIKPRYTDARSGDIRESVLCNKSAIEKLQWEPIYTLEDGLRMTLDHYMKNH